MRIWAVEYCSCTYESAPSVISLHRTAVQAFCKMRKLRRAHYDDETWNALKYLGYVLSPEVSVSKPRSRKGGKNTWWYGIRAIEVCDD